MLASCIIRKKENVPNSPSLRCDNCNPEHMLKDLLKLTNIYEAEKPLTKLVKFLLQVSADNI